MVSPILSNFFKTYERELKMRLNWVVQETLLKIEKLYKRPTKMVWKLKRIWKRAR